MKKALFILLLSGLIFVVACGGGGTEDKTSNSEAPKSMLGKAETYDPKRGEGKFSDENLNISDKLDVAMAKSGDNIQGVKCASCHKLTDERLVGPGWKDVTTRRTAAWLMNFITNPDPMIDKDPEVQAQLELCLVRMPNQNLSDDDARHIYEFMRKNDGVN